MTPQEFYLKEGYAFVSGLIDHSTMMRACDALMAQIPSDGTGSFHQILRTRALLKCVTKGVRNTAADFAQLGYVPKSPSSIYTIAVYPEKSAWEWPWPHIDHSRPEDGFRSLPPPFRIGCLIYLSDSVSTAGATVVWPESHYMIDGLIEQDPQKYELLSSVNQHLPHLKLNPPIEVCAWAGDVLFYDHLCAHSGSKNIGQNVRLALNHKW